MLVGTPIVATRSGGNPEAIEDGVRKRSSITSHGDAAHALHACSDHEVLVARGHAHCREVQSLLGRSAEAIDRGARHLDRQACQQPGHARDVAVVLTGLVGASEDDVVHARVEGTHFGGPVRKGAPTGASLAAADIGGWLAERFG